MHRCSHPRARLMGASRALFVAESFRRFPFAPRCGEEEVSGGVVVFLVRTYALGSSFKFDTSVAPPAHHDSRRTYMDRTS